MDSDQFVELIPLGWMCAATLRRIHCETGSGRTLGNQETQRECAAWVHACLRNYLSEFYLCSSDPPRTMSHGKRRDGLSGIWCVRPQAGA